MGLNSDRLLWFHIPYLVIVYVTSNRPQHDMSNCLGLYIMGFRVKGEALWSCANPRATSG